MSDQIRLDGLIERLCWRRSLRRVWPLLLLLWLAAFVVSARALLRYEWTAGPMQAAPSLISNATALSRQVSGTHSSAPEGLLVIAVHPLCSCTRATLQELEESATSWRQPFHAVILLYQSKSAKTSLRPAAYLLDAQKALHAELVLDEDGREAARFGALTSGEILYYSAPDAANQRRLLFSGGVTAGRGMVGENGSIESLAQAVTKTSSAVAPNSSGADTPAHAPVYGCGLASLAQLGGPTR